jgi:secreted trypsin-like serine protease
MAPSGFIFAWVAVEFYFKKTFSFQKNHRSISMKRSQWLALCGFSLGFFASFSHAIVGGTNASTAEYSFVVQIDIGKNAQYSCSGSMIRDKWVLTAAHCVEGFKAKYVKVLVGAQKYYSDEGDQVTAKRVIVHPDYNMINGNNDVALIELMRKPNVDFDLLNLATKEVTTQIASNNDRLEVSGYGAINKAGTKIDYERLKAGVRVRSNELCQEANDTWDTKITKNMICAGKYNQADKDSCFGDSGGPLFGGYQGKNYVVGITSFGTSNRCAAKEELGVYSRVATLRQWILSKIK